jgi:NADH-quinone oxidoreductase subunit D/NADH-quinone oxidoreductase subunit C/D
MKYLKQVVIAFSRYLVRMKEMRQSLSIVEQLIDNIPEGDVQAKNKSSIEITEGEYYSRVETGKRRIWLCI